MKKLILPIVLSLLFVPSAAFAANEIRAESIAPGEITVTWSAPAEGDLLWGSYEEKDLEYSSEPASGTVKLEHLKENHYYPVRFLWGLNQLNTSAETLAEKLTNVEITKSNTTIENKDISSTSGNNCIFIKNKLENIKIINDHIENCGKNGIELHYPESGEAYTKNLTIENNKINNVGTTNPCENDITLYADNSIIKDNNLTGSPNDAIDLWGKELTFVHNNIHDLTPKECEKEVNHDDAFQTWDNESTEEIKHRHPIVDLTIEHNRIENISGSNGHAFEFQGESDENISIHNNVFNKMGSVSGSHFESDVKNIEVYNNAYNNAGEIQFQEATGTGIFKENWLIETNVLFNKGFKITKSNNYYYKSEAEDISGANEPYGTGDKHGSGVEKITLKEAEEKSDCKC